MRNEGWGMKNEGSGWRVRGEEWRIKVNYTFLMDFGSEFCEKFVSPTNIYSKAWSLKKANLNNLRFSFCEISLILMTNSQNLQFCVLLKMLKMQN